MTSRSKLIMTIQSVALLLMILACSCGGQAVRAPVRIAGDPEWYGEYHGKIVYALGHVPDRRQGRGLPARMIIEPDGPDIRVEIATAGLGPQWLFFLSPGVFAGNEVEFSRTGVPGRDNRRYTVSLRRTGKTVSGRLKVDELGDDSEEPVGGYFLDVTRRESGP